MRAADIAHADRLLDDPLVPLHLLIWSVETAMSTLTCTVETMSWEGFTKDERIALAQLYVPYLVLGKLSAQPCPQSKQA
jgi:EXPERA (EXPanded EBP superfamily)